MVRGPERLRTTDLHAIDWFSGKHIQLMHRAPVIDITVLDAYGTPLQAMLHPHDAKALNGGAVRSTAPPGGAHHHSLVIRWIRIGADAHVFVESCSLWTGNCWPQTKESVDFTNLCQTYYTWCVFSRNALHARVVTFFPVDRYKPGTYTKSCRNSLRQRRSIILQAALFVGRNVLCLFSDVLALNGIVWTLLLRCRQERLFRCPVSSVFFVLTNDRKVWVDVPTAPRSR